MLRRRPDIRLVAPLGLFLGMLLLYLATLTDVHTFDALSYASGVDLKPWTEMFHPHHLAYGPLGILALKVAQAAGYEGRAAVPLQVVNAVAGALGVALFFTTVRRVTQRIDLALVAALLLGSAYAYWYYSIEIEVYTIATLFLLICLELVIRQFGAPSRGRMLALGLVQGGAILFHQTNLLFCVPLVVGLLIPVRDTAGPAHLAPVRDRLKGWWIYALALGLCVALPYLFVGIVVSGFRSPDQFMAWMTEYARTGWWGGPITGKKWSDLGTGVAETLAQPGGALLWLLLAGLLLLHLRRIAAGPRPLLAVLLSWLLIYGGFFLWWEPNNIEFWIASLPPALLLLALALRGERRWAPGVWIALAVAGTALGINYDSITRRGDSRTDLQRTIVSVLGRHSGPADLLLVPDGLIELYLPYYEERYNYLSLNALLYATSGNWDAACAQLRQRIDSSLHAGAAVFIADEVLNPPRLLLERHRFNAEQVRDCLAPYSPDLQPLAMPENVPAYWRIPTAQERAEEAGWSFAGSSQGWQAINAERSQFAGGWLLSPDKDCMLISPLLHLDADHYAAIEIRLSNRTAAQRARLFYAGPDQQFSEEHSILWELQPTTQAVSYRVDLRGRPGWEGIISRLRLDPALGGSGDEILIEHVQLIPYP